MIEFKIDVLEELKKIGLTRQKNKELKILSQATLTSISKGNYNITFDTLNKLCCLLEVQPKDIIRFVETPEDTQNIYKKVHSK